MAKLNDFFKKHLKGGRTIEGAFTTNKKLEEISKKKIVSFELFLTEPESNDSVNFSVPNKNKKFGLGIVRNKLLRKKVKLKTIHLKWIPEKMPPYEGFEVIITFETDTSGTFTLKILNYDRFAVWKKYL